MKKDTNTTSLGRRKGSMGDINGQIRYSKALNVTWNVGDSQKRYHVAGVAHEASGRGSLRQMQGCMR